MDVAITNNVRVRNEFGRFVSKLDLAGIQTTKEAVQKGARSSRARAPRGAKFDKRTPSISKSIYWVHNGTTGYWGSNARHALPQEFGARRHDIPGRPDLLFWWEKYGRFYIPAQEWYDEPGRITIVDHPGHGAQPYLRPAFDMVMRELLTMYKNNLRKMG